MHVSTFSAEVPAGCQKGLSMVVIVLALFLGLVPAHAESNRLDLEFSLPAPKNQAHLDYLGLKGKTEFTLDRVKADILVVEIFSMYCPICQGEAAKINDLYRRLNALTGTSIKILGIGAGNSAFEADFFKKTYGIQFPLFSDDEFTIHKKVGEKGTPFFIVLKPGAPTRDRVCFTHSGRINDLDAFMEKLIEAAR